MQGQLKFGEFWFFGKETKRILDNKPLARNVMLFLG